MQEGTVTNLLTFRDWTSGSYASTHANIESLKKMYAKTVILIDIEGSRGIDYVFEGKKPAFVIIATNPAPADYAFVT